MNRRYNHSPVNHYAPNSFAPNSFPAQQPMPYNNMTYQHPNNMHQMPPPYPLAHQQQRGGHFRNNSFNQPPQGPMMQNYNGAPPREKKGLLSKLRRNSNKQQPAPPTAQSLFSLPPNSTRGAGAAATQAATTTAASGGVLQSIMNPANLTNMLNNTQRVLQAAESIGPLVQQYGPMVKNIPSLWKLYQGLSSTDTDNQNQEEPIKESIPPINPVTNPPHREVHIKPHSPEPSKPFRQYSQGESIPKLFV